MCTDITEKNCKNRTYIWNLKIIVIFLITPRILHRWKSTIFDYDNVKKSSWQSKNQLKYWMACFSVVLNIFKFGQFLSIYNAFGIRNGFNPSLVYKYQKKYGNRLWKLSKRKRTFYTKKCWYVILMVAAIYF